MKKIYEPVILRKLGLSTKFLRNILYTRKLILRVGLIVPSTTIDILALKLHVGHNHRDSKVVAMINILEEHA